MMTIQIDNSEAAWQPLEEAIGTEQCADWMYMFAVAGPRGVIICAYKHAMTRQYLYLSDDGRAWQYQDGEYIEGDMATWIQAALCDT